MTDKLNKPKRRKANYRITSSQLRGERREFHLEEEYESMSPGVFKWAIIRISTTESVVEKMKARLEASVESLKT